jgi:hypothetical protein
MMMGSARCGKVEPVVVPFVVENAIFLMTGSRARGEDGSFWASAGLATGDNVVILVTCRFREIQRRRLLAQSCGFIYL